jgi:hypothetical protein
MYIVHKLHRQSQKPCQLYFLEIQDQEDLEDQYSQLRQDYLSVLYNQDLVVLYILDLLGPIDLLNLSNLSNLSVQSLQSVQYNL